MTWEEELEASICTIEQLREYIELTPEEEKQLREIIERHPMRINGIICL